MSINQTIIIPGRLPGMNEVNAMAKSGRGHYQPYAIEKQKAHLMICLECKRQKITPCKRINLIITWYCKDKRRDKDNIIAGGTKLIMDSLQHAGIIKNDGWAEIGDITHKFEIDKNERIKIELEET
jgi:Holliday junction resolvase RusA-like endonuclease